MRKIDIILIKPGVKISKTIYTGSGNALLKAGTVLTDKLIKKLKLLGVAYTYIDDGLNTDIVVEDVINLKTRLAATNQVKNILLKTKESGKVVIKPQDIYATVDNITSDLLTNQSMMLNLIDLRLQDSYTFAHSVNVCVLSLMTGITLGFNTDELNILGSGALMHDLGKMFIPDNILNKPAPLNDEEFVIMKKHASLGHDLLATAKDLSDIPAIIAWQHHESFDGSGYPQGIQGNSFHDYAQIVAIADKFDALTANRIYRKAFPAHEAYEMCAATGNYFFKDYIAKAFLHNIAAYPSGTLVQLNNDLIALVLDTPKGYSIFPTVRLLFDPNGQPLSHQKNISLLEADKLSIVKVLSEAEIEKLKV